MKRLTGSQLDILGGSDDVMDLPLFGGSNVVGQVDPFTVEAPIPPAGDQLDLVGGYES